MMQEYVYIRVRWKWAKRAVEKRIKDNDNCRDMKRVREKKVGIMCTSPRPNCSNILTLLIMHSLYSLCETSNANESFSIHVWCILFSFFHKFFSPSFSLSIVFLSYQFQLSVHVSLPLKRQTKKFYADAWMLLENIFADGVKT